MGPACHCQLPPENLQDYLHLPSQMFHSLSIRDDSHVNSNINNWEYLPTSEWEGYRGHLPPKIAVNLKFSNNNIY